jgi:hypothetical protein
MPRCQAGAVILLGEFNTIFNDLGRLTVEDDSVFSYGDLVDNYLFFECHFDSFR